MGLTGGGHRRGTRWKAARTGAEPVALSSLFVCAPPPPGARPVRGAAPHCGERRLSASARSESCGRERGEGRAGRGGARAAEGRGGAGLTCSGS